MIRTAVPGDESELARLHVAAWRETYRGILPDAVLDALDEDERRDLWRRAVGQGSTRIFLFPGAGFAQSGPQRYDDMAADWPGELWSIYLLRSAQGRRLGRALFDAVRPQTPFATCVFAANGPACAFYRRLGGRHLRTTVEDVHGVPLAEHVYGFPAPLTRRI